MNEKILKKLNSRHFTRGCIAFTAAVIMHFSPDYIDEVIKLFLLAFGISDLTKE